MSAENFITASRNKLRFGQFATEDLWDLPLTSSNRPSLDNLAKAVNREIKAEAEESFIPSKNRVTSPNTLRLEILKYVIDVKVAENEARKTKAENEALLAQLEDIATDKSSEQLKALPLEDIKKKIAELKASA